MKINIRSLRRIIRETIEESDPNNSLITAFQGALTELRRALSLNRADPKGASQAVLSACEVFEREYKETGNSYALELATECRDTIELFYERDQMPLEGLIMDLIKDLSEEMMKIG